jgi:serine/threonine protein kinase
MLHVMSLPESSHPAMPSRNRIGRFHITRELGRGVLNTVYLGHDPIADRQVAIKTFHLELSLQQRRMQERQLINEARAAGRLSHPHIVTIFEASVEGPETYLVMEHLEGSALSTLLSAGRTFEFDVIATICSKLAGALDHAHRHKVVHRDIKPANIFMIDGHQPKLVDFGIARTPNHFAVHVTSADNPNTLFCNNLLGTPNYMSPEQASGERVDHRTDIYSLGAVMYQMLTGRTPFDAVETDTLLQLIKHKIPDQPHKLNATVPKALSRIAMKAMNKQPDKRYQHAADMMLDIKRYLADGKLTRRRLRMALSESEVQRRVPYFLTQRSALHLCCAALIGAIAMWLLLH